MYAAAVTAFGAGSRGSKHGRGHARDNRPLG